MVDQPLRLAGPARDGVWLSFELFPPKTQAGLEALWGELARLEGLGPDFVSVTYGAGGSTRERSLAVVDRVSKETGLTPVAHLTCVGASKRALRELVGEFLDAGIRNFLALRGDPPKGVAADDWRPGPRGVAFAQQLITLIFEVAADRGVGRGELAVGVAAFPGGHAQSSSLAQDIAVLAQKERLGASFALSQLFFDPWEYAVFVDRAREGGVSMPIIPGVMPMTSPERLRRMVVLSGKAYPKELLAGLEAREGDARYEFGMDATARLAARLLEFGAPGVHVYTLNQAGPATDLVARLGLRVPGL